MKKMNPFLENKIIIWIKHTMEEVPSIIRNEFIENTINTKLSSSNSICYTSNNVTKVSGIILPKQTNKIIRFIHFSFDCCTNKITTIISLESHQLMEKKEQHRPTSLKHKRIRRIIRTISSCVYCKKQKQNEPFLSGRITERMVAP